MSEREVGRLRVLERLMAGYLSQVEAAGILELSARQVRRLMCRYRKRGAAGLTHGLRGRASNRALPAERAREIQALLARHYADFGPTLASEKLAERHGIQVSAETVRRLMTEAGLWRPKPVRRQAPHPLRERRARRGELIQVDGSLHRWFEYRAPACTLLVFIDDATGQLMALRFVAAESTLAYMDLLREYILAHGLPAALYSDRHSVFRKNHPQGALSPTQFARALAELGIEGIQAHTPQAKGRVERANQTLQDRLVKELRLAGLSDMAAANAWLPAFVVAHNQRFAVAPRVAQDAHVPYLGPLPALARILAIQATRKLSANLSCQFHRELLQVHAPGQARRLSGQTVTLVAYPNRQVAMYHGTQPLRFERGPNPRGVAPTVDSKALDARVQQAVERRAKGRPAAPSHPWKRWVSDLPNPHEPQRSPP